MLVEIQVMPRPAGDTENPYRHVEAAIAVIRSAGLDHEVGALGTVIEGPADQVWPLLRDVHDAALRSGAESVATAIKVHETPGVTVDIAERTRKFRG